MKAKATANWQLANGRHCSVIFC